MALELQNELQQKVQSDNLGIQASNRLALSNLKTQENIQAAEQDLGKGQDAFSIGMSAKQGYKIYQAVSKAGGVGAYGAQEGAKLMSAVGPGAKRLGSAAVDLGGALAERVGLTSGFTPGVVGSAPLGFAKEGVTFASGPEFNTAERAAAAGLGAEAAVPTASLSSAASVQEGYVAAPATEARPLPAVTEDAGKMTLSDAMEVGGKLAGVAGGGFAAYEDFTKGMHGMNNWDKAANILTIGSSVLDFIPGMEAVGMLGNAAAAITGAIGNEEDNTAYKAGDDQLRQASTAPSETATQVTVSQGSAPDASRSQMPASSTF